ERPTESSVSWLTLSLWPFAMLGRFVAHLEGGGVRGRWPTPRGRSSRYLVEIITGFQGGINGNVLFWLVFIAACLGPASFIGYFLYTELPVYWHIVSNLAAYLQSTGPFDWRIVFLPVRIILYGVVIALLILAICVSFLGLRVIHLSFRATRAILYGLITTYVNGPGAPAWASKRENIVALPIPPNVTTLGFGIDPSTRERLAEAAYQATIQKLDPLLLRARPER